ncbi:MAG: hypothetical protein N2444_09625 [Methylocystis sp.]|nr:hypothetical protein [Methylocystis sp.]
MLAERLLALTTAAFFAVSLGVGLSLVAVGGAPPVTETLDAFAPGLIPLPRPDAPAPGDAGQEVFPDRGAARLAVERQIAATQEYAPYFARLRETFAADYEATLDSFATELAQTQQKRSVDYFLSEAVRRLRQSRGLSAAKAGSQPMALIFDTQLDVLRATAQEDARMCVAFLYGATTADFERFAQKRRALLAAVALASLDAIASGQAKPVDHEAPTESDFKLLEDALAGRGLAKGEIDALLDGKMPTPPLEDARMCAAGQTYFEVLKTLPEPVRSKVYGLALELMARS